MSSYPDPPSDIALKTLLLYFKISYNELMGKANANQPATKADINALKTDLNSLESKLHSEIQGVKSELKAEIDGVKSELKTEIADVKSELKTEIGDVRSELKAEIGDVRSDLKADIKNLSGEILKVHFKIDRMENRLNTEFATKNDINRVFNLLDAIAGDIKSYQRKDVLRGDAVMRHEEQIAAHETRITLLEEKK